MPRLGRPPKPTSEATITRRLQILLTEAQYAHAAARAAERADQSIAAYIRALIDKDMD